MEGLENLVAQWAAMGGFGALIGFLVNILKAAGIVKEGQGVVWSTGLNLLGLVGLLMLGVYAPNFDLTKLDTQVAEFVRVGLVVFAYVVQLFGAKAGHAAVRGTPLIGKTWSK